MNIIEEIYKSYFSFASAIDYLLANYVPHNATGFVQIITWANNTLIQAMDTKCIIFKAVCDTSATETDSL